MANRIFLDRHGDLRSGWRIALFIVFFGVLSACLLGLLRVANVYAAMADRFAVLISGLAASALMTRLVNHKQFTAIGLSMHPSMFRELGVGCLLGFLMMTGIVIIGVAGGYLGFASRGLSYGGAAAVTAESLVSCIAGALGEEILFRGYAFQTLVQGVTFLPAVFLSSIFFAAAHLGNPSLTVFSLTNVALAGILFAFAYMKTRSLWLPFGIHFTWNFSQSTLYGLPTSGLLIPEKTLVLASQQGPDWILGGSFGPEGGVLATAALVIGLWYILKAPYLSVPEGIITLDSVEDLLVSAGVTGKAKS